jgi:hypothetical protein
MEDINEKLTKKVKDNIKQFSNELRKSNGIPLNNQTTLNEEQQVFNDLVKLYVPYFIKFNQTHVLLKMINEPIYYEILKRLQEDGIYSEGIGLELGLAKIELSSEKYFYNKLLSSPIEKNMRNKKIGDGLAKRKWNLKKYKEDIFGGRSWQQEIKKSDKKERECDEIIEMVDSKIINLLKSQLPAQETNIDLSSSLGLTGKLNE